MVAFTDLRPKGRGRPQRILLGVWPDEHIRGVIRAVVFRDGHSPHMVKEEPSMYPALANYGACNGPEGAVSPSAAAAAVAAVAQGKHFTHIILIIIFSFYLLLCIWFNDTFLCNIFFNILFKQFLWTARTIF